MNETMFVKPAEGMRVVDPDTRKPLPAEGAAVPRSVYWLRRLQDHDVLEAEAPVVVDAPAKPNVQGSTSVAEGRTPGATRTKREVL